MGLYSTSSLRKVAISFILNRFNVAFLLFLPFAIDGYCTDFFVSHQGLATSVFVRKGAVYSFNPSAPGRAVTLSPGTMTTVTGRNAPTPPKPASQAEILRLFADYSPGVSSSLAASAEDKSSGDKARQGGSVAASVSSQENATAVVTVVAVAQTGSASSAAASAMEPTPSVICG